MKEKTCQDSLVLLSAYSPSISFRQEVSIPNTRDRSTKTRRLDLVQELPDLVRVFEVKTIQVTKEVLREVLSKSYRELSAEYFHKEVELVIVAPSITQEALDIIQRTKGSHFLHITELSNLILKDFSNSLPRSAYFMIDRLKEEFYHIL